MKILMIASYLPFPLLSGGQNRLYNIIKQLSSRHEVTLVCEKRPHQTKKDIEEVEKICKKVITVERRKQWSIKNILKTTTSTHSFLYNGHTHPGMQQKIKEELAKNNFDIIHVETFYVYQNLPENICHSSGRGATMKWGIPEVKRRVNPGDTNNSSSNQSQKLIPVVLVEHNIEYQVYQRYMQQAPIFLRPLLLIDINKIRKEEENAWKKAAIAVVVSEDDKKVIELTGIKSVVIANGVNPDQFTLKDINKARQEKEKRILFIGDFKWIQNQDTAAWIIKEIWPKIKLHYESLVIPADPVQRGSPLAHTSATRVTKAGIHHHQIKLWIVARVIPENIKTLTTDPDILFDEKGSIAPTWEIFQRATIVLAPIRVGGGTSYKILESMSCGTPTVITPLSAQALNAENGKEAQVGGNAAELSEKTLQLLQDATLYERISLNGRKLIEENYTWKAITNNLEQVYKEAIKD